MIAPLDTQWAYLRGIRDFVFKKKDYLLAQVGNPEGPDKPNKKASSFSRFGTISMLNCCDLQYYDPRVWVREGEKTLVERVKEACADLGNVGS
jgi:fructose-bisphosphate aldolase class II